MDPVEVESLQLGKEMNRIRKTLRSAGGVVVSE